MDQYVVKSKRTLVDDGRASTKRKRVAPIKDVNDVPLQQHPLSGAVSRENAPILSSLNMSSNAVTGSTIYSRTTHIQSCATGHQEVNGRKAGSWMTMRNSKLLDQARPAQSSIFKGVIIYLSGPTGQWSIQQMIAAIQENGGQTRPMFSSSCTHIVSCSSLSAKKNDDYIHVQSRKAKAKIVTPDWVIDSVASAKRLPEHAYAVRVDQNQQSVMPHVTTSSKRSPRLLAKSKAESNGSLHDGDDHSGALVVSSQETASAPLTESDNDLDMPPSAQRR